MFKQKRIVAFSDDAFFAFNYGSNFHNARSFDCEGDNNGTLRIFFQIQLC